MAIRAKCFVYSDLVKVADELFRMESSSCFRSWLSFVAPLRHMGEGRSAQKTRTQDNHIRKQKHFIESEGVRR